MTGFAERTGRDFKADRAGSLKDEGIRFHPAFLTDGAIAQT